MSDYSKMAAEEHYAMFDAMKLALQDNEMETRAVQVDAVLVEAKLHRDAVLRILYPQDMVMNGLRYNRE